MSYYTEVLADTPASYWRLGEASGTTAVDEQANSAGTYVGTITLGAASLLTTDADTSVSFGPDDTHVDLGTPNATSTLAGWTWEVWLNTSYQAVATPGLYGELTNDGTATILRQVHQTTTWDLQVRVYDGTTVQSRTVTGLPYDTTMHLVVTVEDAQTTSPTSRVYRDGVQIASFNDYGTTLVAPYRTQGLGVRDLATDHYLGRMDEAAFYTSALSAARVAAHYDADTVSQLATPSGFTFVETVDTREVVGAWSAVTDAATYDYEVEEWDGSAWQAFASSATTDPTVTFTLDSADGVSFSTLYRARVRAVPAP